MSKSLRHVFIATLALTMIALTAYATFATTPRLAGEYQNIVEASAPGHYYDLKLNGNYEKGVLSMVDGHTVHGDVIERGTWEEEIGGIHFTHMNEDGKKVNYNTIYTEVLQMPPFNLPWTFAIYERDQTVGTYYQFSYYE